MFVKRNSVEKNGVVYTTVLVVKSVRIKGEKNPKHETIANITKFPEYIQILIENALKNKDIQLACNLINFCQENKEFGEEALIYHIIEELGITSSLKHLNENNAKIIIALIMNRIIQPLSKMATVQWLKETAIERMLGLKDEEINLNKVYRAMDEFAKELDAITKHFCGNKINTSHFMLYDITSVYFEGFKCETAKFGHSRDEKPQNKQILLGMCLNENGFPIHFEIFEGNIQDKQTVIPMIETVKNKYGIKKCVFVGDRGMITLDNIDYLNEKEMGYIIALKHQKAIKLLDTLKLDDMDLFDKKIPVTIHTENNQSKKFVLCGSEYRKWRDELRFNRILEKGRKALNEVKSMIDKGLIKDKQKIIKRAQKKLTKSGADVYFDFSVEEKDKIISFNIIENTELINAHFNLCGYYILETSEVEMSDAEVEKNYKNLKMVENAFKELKGKLKVRPVFHYNAERVKAHVIICVFAQAIIGYAKNILKVNNWLNAKEGKTFETFLQTFRIIKLNKYSFLNNKIEYSLTHINKDTKKFLSMFNIPLSKFTKIQKM